MLTVTDVFSREALSVSAERSFRARKVTAVLDRLFAERGGVEVILDNGSDFTSNHLDGWAYQRAVKLDFIRPGKPVENCFIESFNGSFGTSA